MQIHNDEYSISTDRNKLDLPMIHGFLSTQAYWCLNIPFAIFKRSAENSLCFGVYQSDRQVGFARIITDYATIAYLGDVFILPEHRGKGLSKRLVGEIMAHPDLQGLRRWMLLTSDAHGLYRQFGWKSIANPDRFMEIANPDIYKTSTV
ncbi:MAG TPA: GNAT family N-acetyltransferase [Puia sp.]|jgi:GNAT superfamily N-acetyltransferase|nr:GNAT family N-acetyltransferase [Puia sp.]